MRRSLVLAGAVLLASVTFAAPAHAQGSSVYAHSSCMSARNGAGVADPCADGSAVFYNPAALAAQPGALGLTMTWIRTDSEFLFDEDLAEPFGRDAGTTPVPAAFLQYRVSPRLAVGIGGWAPYGLGIEWPVCPAGGDPDCVDFEGRFFGFDNELRSVYIQPTVAYQVVPGRLSVGAGVDFVRGSIEIIRRLDLAEVAVPGTPFTFANLGIPLGTDFAETTLEGDGTTVTGHAAVLAQLTDRLSLGARYLHSATVDFDEGTATFRPVETGLVLPPNNPFGLPAGTPVDLIVAGQFQPGGALAEQTVATELTFPAQAVVGLAFDATPQLKLLADYQWTGWSEFDRAVIEFGVLPEDTLVFDYEDASTYRLGAEYRASDALSLRAGFGYNTAATPRATPLLPEGERNYYTGGIGYAFTDRLRADVMFQVVDQQDRRGVLRPGGEEVGVFTSSASLVGATLSYRFGPARP